MAQYKLCGFVLETEWALLTPLQPTAGDADLRFDVVSEPPEKGAWRSTSSQDDATGNTYLWIGTIAGHDVIKFPSLGDAWFIGPDRIVFHLRDHNHAYQVEVLLLSMLVAEWLDRRGVTSLHGAAASDARSAVGMLGGNGRGKTSMCLALVERGWKLLTDDLLAVDTNDGGARVLPSFPQTRLWPPDARRVFGTAEYAKAHPNYEKLRVPLDRQTFSDVPAELQVLYLPGRVPELREPTFERLNGSDAIFAMLHNAFSRNLSELHHRKAAWFQRMAELAHRVPVFVLGYPNDVSRIDQVAEAVIEHRDTVAGC